MRLEMRGRAEMAVPGPMERRRVGILPVVERTAVKTRQVPLRTAQKQAVAQVLALKPGLPVAAAAVRAVEQ